MFIFKRRDLFTMLNELRAGTLSSVKIMEEVVERSMASQKTPIPMEYFAHQDFATMLDEAFKADDNYHKGVNRRLEGLPIAVKDNIDVLYLKGAPMTAGTSSLVSHTSKFEGSLWQHKMRHNGVIMAGRTTMPELSLGTVTKNSFYGSPKSAFDKTRTSGGSSGGSGGAVGAGVVPVALGTDNSGGIRIPAACNGVVGYRPTINRWPSDFGMKISPTFDSIGPIT